MESLLKTWNGLSEENQLLLKKSLVWGLLFYILLLALHDLLPYALTGVAVFYLYRWVLKKNV
ncbi:hypothetical protein [Prochlorococcus marinus]|uniref:Uncharacterized protein n=1 Tax=Prochlorococcus marinus (strain MIT 9211) TaxID=93059 RepID=A9BBC4_PROM4|nr:hypothetical protein [Prochlorococcus marinus]ABX09136.1 Hypothetical protein P9211_12051 [Prochlorococcus marinus str. MIT 9211]